MFFSSNRTPALTAATRHSSSVLVACLRSAPATVSHIHGFKPSSIALVCAGSDDAMSLEDFYCAGLMTWLLAGSAESWLSRSKEGRELKPRGVSAIVAVGRRGGRQFHGYPRRQRSTSVRQKSWEPLMRSRPRKRSKNNGHFGHIKRCRTSLLHECVRQALRSTTQRRK